MSTRICLIWTRKPAWTVRWPFCRWTVLIWTWSSHKWKHKQTSLCISTRLWTVNKERWVIWRVLQREHFLLFLYISPPQYDCTQWPSVNNLNEWPSGVTFLNDLYNDLNEWHQAILEGLPSKWKWKLQMPYTYYSQLVGTVWSSRVFYSDCVFVEGALNPNLYYSKIS